MIIKDLRSIQILDSRGFPTIQTEVILSDGTIGIASVPSGISKGKYEATEKRDEEKEFNGLGVIKSVELINIELKDLIIGRNVMDQLKIDHVLLNTDATNSKDYLGANTILSISLAVLRASSLHLNIPLYKRINDLYYQLFGIEEEFSLPIPMFNLFNGGINSHIPASFQEFMIVPIGIDTYSERLRAGVEVDHKLRELINYSPIQELEEGNKINDELYSPFDILNLLSKAVEKAGYKVNHEIVFAIDVAASQLYDNGSYYLSGENRKYKESYDYMRLSELYLRLCRQFSIFSIEDPFAEDDEEGWKYFKELLEQNRIPTIVIGDDLIATNKGRFEKTKDHIHGAIVKPNQIGSVIETLEFIHGLKVNKKQIIVSHRSGETNDPFIMDLAVGINAEFIKSGEPAGGERIAKYNRGLEIGKILDAL